jgi:predicted AAA+ superfamily ATPase
MNNSELRQIVEEQKAELALFKESEMVPREKEPDIKTESNLAQIITGIRRCGKSTLALQALQNKHYAYINFDDERFINFEADTLNDLLEALYTVYGDFEYLLLDEIQNIEGWHLFVNRLLRNKIKIVLTGSNANLLSREMASHLTGRYAAIELLPFSFHEYLIAKEINILNTTTAKGRGLTSKYFSEYLFSGGFPEVLKGEEQKSYVSNLFEAIVTRDIIFRYKIRNVRTFREVALWLTGNFAKEISYNRIKNIFDLGSENTAKNYVTYLE